MEDSNGKKPIIKVEDVSVIYWLGKSNETWALNNVSAEIYPHEYVIFFGPSGCGKSTLLNSIAGLQSLTRGKVYVAGRDLTQLTPSELVYHRRLHIGMVFQAFNLIPTLNVLDNVALPQILGGRIPGVTNKTAEALLEKFGIAHLKSRYIRELSGGQQQRVAIARSLMYQPPIILADEPTGNLDSKNAENVLDVFTELNEKFKKTIIQVTHNPNNLQRADRIFFLKDGKIIREVRNPQKRRASGEPEEKLNEMERLAQLYPWLPESRLRAKFIVGNLLFPYGIEDQLKIELVVDSYISGKIDEKELERILDQSPEEGGVNLYRQSARKLTEKIVNLTKEVKRLEEVEKYKSLEPASERVASLRGYLLNDYKGEINFDQIKRLESFIEKRMNGELSREGFVRALDLPFNKGGVGLNRRTARKFGKDLDLVILK